VASGDYLTAAPSSVQIPARSRTPASFLKPGAGDPNPDSWDGAHGVGNHKPRPPFKAEPDS